MVRRPSSVRQSLPRKRGAARPNTGHRDYLGRPLTLSQCRAGKCVVHPHGKR